MSKLLGLSRGWSSHNRYLCVIDPLPEIATCMLVREPKTMDCLILSISTSNPPVHLGWKKGLTDYNKNQCRGIGPLAEIMQSRRLISLLVTEAMFPTLDGAHPPMMGQV